MKKLHLRVPSPLIHWTHFLSNRPQTVRVDILTVTQHYFQHRRSTGQGVCTQCIPLHCLYKRLSESIPYCPLLQICRWHGHPRTVTVMTLSHSISYFSTWCDDNSLHLNASKMKELLISSLKALVVTRSHHRRREGRAGLTITSASVSISDIYKMLSTDSQPPVN